MQRGARLNLLLGGILMALGASAASAQHFHPKGKLPSTFTLERQEALRKSLPFDDKRDFEEQKRGFIAAPPYKQIAAGKAKLEGKREVYDQLKSTLVQFELGFEMMPGTGKADLTPDKAPFKQDRPADTSGG